MNTTEFNKVQVLAEFTKNQPNRGKDLVYSARMQVPEAAKYFTRDLLALAEITVESIEDLYNTKYREIDCTGDYSIVRYVFKDQFKH